MIIIARATHIFCEALSQHKVCILVWMVQPRVQAFICCDRASQNNLDLTQGLKTLKEKDLPLHLENLLTREQGINLNYKADIKSNANLTTIHCNIKLQHVDV